MELWGGSDMNLSCDYHIVWTNNNLIKKISVILFSYVNRNKLVAKPFNLNFFENINNFIMKTVLLELLSFDFYLCQICFYMLLFKFTMLPFCWSTLSVFYEPWQLAYVFIYNSYLISDLLVVIHNCVIFSASDETVITYRYMPYLISFHVQLKF